MSRSKGQFRSGGLETSLEKRWFGHVCKCPNHLNSVDICQVRRRPQKRFVDLVKEDMQRAVVTEEAIGDRDRGR